jgi:hypothetical protein
MLREKLHPTSLTSDQTQMSVEDHSRRFDRAPAISGLHPVSRVTENIRPLERQLHLFQNTMKIGAIFIRKLANTFFADLYYRVLWGAQQSIPDICEWEASFSLSSVPHP